MKVTKPILIWSAPRSTSTAFERAFMQREDTVTLHEPFGEPCYFGPERISNRYSEEKCAASESRDVTYSDIHGLIMQTQSRVGNKLVVVKEMARCVVSRELISTCGNSNPSALSDDDLKKYRHTFLIRTPQKTVVSFYKATKAAECGDYGAFETRDAGFLELRALLDYTRRLLPEEPVILLDSADLIAEPERALRAFCSAVGISPDPNMLSWEAQRIPSFDKWRGWHDQAENSTGFKEIPQEEEVEVPQVVLEAIQESMPIYESLRELKLKI